MSSMQENISEVLEDLNNFMPVEHCSGFPYLKLQSTDYLLKNSKDIYANYVEIIKRLGYKNSWTSNKLSFFDIHPVFSDATIIPSFMGFHLSLMLYERGIASSTETLYFDTPSNWASFTKIIDKRAFPVCSWLRHDSRNGEKPSEEQDDEVNKYTYLPINVVLVKGVELSNPDKQVPVVFDKQLSSWYKSQVNPIENIRDILVTEIGIFQNSIARTLENESGKFTTSAKYLFALIFCREYGIKNEIFTSVADELNLKFNFANDADIIKYTLLCFSHLDQVKIRLGQYFVGALNHEQIDITLNAQKETNAQDSKSDNNDDDLDENTGDGFVLKENKKKQTLPLKTRFHQMQPALSDERACRIEIYKIWRELVLCFYGLDLTQAVYNKLRNIMDTYVGDAIQQHQLLDYKNLDTQMVALKTVTFEIYQKSIYDYDVIVTNNSLLANQLFEQLEKPKLTKEEQNSINLLNTKAQAELREAILEGYREDLINLLNLISSKFAHSQYNSLRGERLKNIDLSSFKRMVMGWYKTNYIDSYLALNNDYFFISNKIKNDLDRFTGDSLFQIAILNEISNFVKIGRAHV